MSSLVTLITVNYRQPKVTLELLKSIKEEQKSDLQVILIDNDPLEWVDFEPVLPGIQVIRTKENLGYAGAVNLGIAAAKGSFYFLVNNDTEINSNLIPNLLACFEDPNVGAVCPVIRYYDRPDMIQYAGLTAINSFTGRNKMLKTLPEGNRETSFFHGAAVMLSANAVSKAGLMSESYFLFYEELDWSLQIKDAGYKIVVSPNAFIYHKESISTGKNSPLKLYYLTRNRIHFMRKNSESFFVFLLFFCLVSFPKKWLSLYLNNETLHRKAYLRAIMDSVISPKFGIQHWAA